MSGESVIQAAVLRALNTGDTRLFRNNVGIATTARGKVRFGLHPGSGDLIGWTRTKITGDMVGRTVAVFTSLEVKSADAKLRPNQRWWLEAVRAAGGIAAVVHCEKEARDACAPRP